MGFLAKIPVRKRSGVRWPRQGPSARKSGSSVIYRPWPRSRNPARQAGPIGSAPPAEGGGGGLRAPLAQHLPPGGVRGGGTRPPPHLEGAGADLRHKGGRREERGPVGTGPWGYLRAGGQQGPEGRACTPNPTPATSGTALPALFRPVSSVQAHWTGTVTQGRGERVSAAPDLQPRGKRSLRNGGRSGVQSGTAQHTPRSSAQERETGRRGSTLTLT